MNAISKRLLGWLCVIAMVLSFAPVMNLSNFAVETNAAAGDTNWAAAGITNPAGNNYDNSDGYFTGTCLAEGNNSCPVCGNQNVTWEKLTANGTLGAKNYELTRNRHLYFDSTITSIKNIAIKSNTNNQYSLCIWLQSSNNLTVASDTSDRYVGFSADNTTAGGTINIFGEGSITDENGGSLFNIRNEGVLNLYGGNFVYKNKADSYTNGAITFTSSKGGTVNIYNGATIGPALNDNGTPDDTSDDYQDTSNVYMNVFYGAATYPGTINMYGGTIQNGVGPADGACGNVNVRNKGIFNMYGGTIKGGTYLASATATKGGNIYTGTNATVNIYGGTIDGGRAANGGNIYVNSGTTTLSIYGGTIKNGVSTGDGGNISTKAAAGAHVYFYGGTITKGDATGYGGNVYAYTNFTMSENYTGIPTIMSDGDADKGGGNLYMRLNAADSSVSFAINGGTISGGEHTGTSGSGGNVFLRDGVCTMTDGTITGGVAPTSGGNVYVTENDGTFDMQGGVISRGSNAAGGKTRTANIQVNEGGNFTLEEGVRLQNQATLVDKDGYDAWYATDADALAAYGSNTEYMTLAKNALTLNKDVVINTYGYDVALSGTGNVKLIDTANHDFETASGKVTVTGDVEITENDVTVDGKRYITIKNDNTYSAHYVKMALTGIALRPSADGLYYKGQFECDSTLARCVTQFGIAVGAVDENGNAVLPTDLNNKNVKYSNYVGANFTPNEEHVVTAYGVLVYGILRKLGETNRTAQGNVDYMNMAVNANPYMKIDTGDGTITIMAYGENDAADKYGNKSLLQVVTRIDTLLSTDELDASDEAKRDMVAFANKWIDSANMGDLGVQTMSDATENIRNWTPEQAVS